MLSLRLSALLNSENVSTRCATLYLMFLIFANRCELQFYKGQAEIYDTTRNGLLRGRKTMLSLSSAHLRELRTNCSSTDKPQRLVWVDIGGGTGWNIEAMDAFHPIANFDAVYLVDLCEPLLDVARRRFARKGWTNVHCICADAASFVLPEPEWAEGSDPRGSLSFVTFSYSLSMVSLCAYILMSQIVLSIRPRYLTFTLSLTAYHTYFLRLLVYSPW